MANPTPKASSTRVQLPVGPSGDEPPNAPEGGLAYANDTEVVRVKTSTGWEDVGGGGGGTITTINSPDGSITVTNPGGPTVSVEVNEANVTLAGDVNGPANANQVNKIHETSGPTALTIGNINDFQLLQRVGATVVGTAYPATTLVGDVNGPIISNQVNAIHETSGPTALTIGSIAAGQVLQRVGNTVVGVAGGLPSGNPFIDPPLVPGAYDDEFDSGSPDLALRGWTVKNSANATMTRVGDISPWSVSASSLTNTQYLSTLVGSQIMIQISPGGYMSCTKAVSGGFASGSNATVWGRMGNPVYGAVNTTVSYSARVFASYASAGNPDLTNFIYTQSYTSGATNTHTMSYGRTLAGANSDTPKSQNISVQDILGVRLQSGTSTWSAFSADSASGSTTSYAQNAPTSTSIGFVGFSFDDIATGTGTPNSTTSRIWAVDFFRFASGSTAWIAQTPKVSVTGTYAGLPSGNPYIDPPATANSFDDEFEGGSADLATRGYTVKNSAGTTLTRGGDVSPWDPTGPSAGTYWSTLKGSQLLVQFIPGSSLQIMKAVTLAAGDTYFARIGTGQRFDNSGSSTNFYEVGLYGNSGGVTDGNNRVYVSTYSTTSGAANIDITRATGGAFSGTTKSPYGATIGDIRGVRWESSTNYNGFLTDSASGDTLSSRLTGAPSSATLVWFAITLSSASLAGTVPEIISIDFIRKTTSSTWIAQTPRPVLWNVVNGNITDYTAKSVPVVADQIYLANSAANNAIYRATLTSVAESGAVVPLRYHNIYIDPPSSPDARNDEFDSGSADLATRGWTVVNAASGATLTRSGDVVFATAPSGIGATNYLSTIRNSRLYIQTNPATVLYMYKSTTGNLQLTAHVFQPNVFTGNILQPIISNNTTPSTPAGNRSVYGGYENPNVVIAYNNQNVFTVPNNTAYGGTGQSMVVMLNYNDTTKNFTGLLNQPVPGTITYNGNAGITATSMSSVNAGVRLVTAGNAYTWAEIDYVRWYSIGDWFPA